MTPQEAIERIRLIVDQHAGKRFDSPSLGLALGEVAHVLAQVTPGTGATLTPEEAARVAHWYYADPMFYDATNEAIVARLREAAQ